MGASLTPSLAGPCGGRVVVTFYLGERSAARLVTQRLFGRGLRLWEYAGLAGAPAGAHVELGTLDGDLYLETRDPAARCYRAIQRLRPGREGPLMVIDALHILPRRMRRKGLGLAMLTRQLTAARRLGVRRIETTAGRRGEENGYYSWPRFGFDGPLPPEICRILPRGLCHARRVLDLMESDRGRHWWSRHGVTLDVAFDLARQSRSWGVIARYAGEKSRGGSPRGTSAAAWPCQR